MTKGSYKGALTLLARPEILLRLPAGYAGFGTNSRPPGSYPDARFPSSKIGMAPIDYLYVELSRDTVLRRYAQYCNAVRRRLPTN